MKDVALLSRDNEQIKKIKQKYGIVKKLEDNSIFSIDLDKKYGLYICELCDWWYWCELNKKDCEDLSKFFLELSKICNKGE